MSSGARMGKVELTSERYFLKIPRELHFWPWLNLFIAFIHFILTDTVETTATETITKTKNKLTKNTVVLLHGTIVIFIV